MDIKKLSDEALKAMAYDCISNMESATNNLKIINEELQSRKETASPQETNPSTAPSTKKDK